MWLDGLINPDKVIEFGKDIKHYFLVQHNELPKVGEVGVFYKIKYFDDPIVWDDVDNKYVTLCLCSKSIK